MATNGVWKGGGGVVEHGCLNRETELSVFVKLSDTSQSRCYCNGTSN